ncbi:MAG: hypothetical protein JNN15_20690 [Blastocatellia bacterium]|nr:hypothetical protein [Blastocatellia bacterium]
MKKLILLLLVLLTLLILAPIATGQNVEIDQRTKIAILSALDEERHAIALYQAVISKYGKVKPFVKLVEAEKRHEESLKFVCERYSIAIPENLWRSDAVILPDNLAETYSFAMESEILGIEGLDAALKFLKQEDIKTIFEHLRDASLYNHIPALQRGLKRALRGTH